MDQEKFKIPWHILFSSLLRDLVPWLFVALLFS